MQFFLGFLAYTHTLTIFFQEFSEILYSVGSVLELLNWCCAFFVKSLPFPHIGSFHFFQWFAFLYIALFAVAIMSAKMVIPTMASNATFAVIPNAHTRLFTQNIPTTVASPKSRNRSCNGRQMEQAFERPHDVSGSVA
jgi:hypothetical protein